MSNGSTAHIIMKKYKGLIKFHLSKESHNQWTLGNGEDLDFTE